MSTPVFNLSNLDGSNGFRLDGVVSGDFSGTSVSNAGDVNGDSFADVIIGDDSGSDYVVFGRATDFDAAMNLSSLDGSNGFRLDGAGSSVSGAGDVNGDSFDDVIVSGGFVIFGKASGFDAAMDVSSLDGSNGFRLYGGGRSVSNAGDVNGDGFGDVIVDASDDRDELSFVVFGQASGFDATMDLSSLDGSNGFRLNGASSFGNSAGNRFYYPDWINRYVRRIPKPCQTPRSWNRR